MANTATLATLRARVKSQADNPIATDAEINAWINLGLGELHDLLATKFEDYFESSDTITPDGTKSDFDLPDDFYKMLSVDLLSGGIRTKIGRYYNTDRNEYSNRGVVGKASLYKYRIIGSVLRISPTPPSNGDTIELSYIPQFEELTSDGDTVHEAVPQGWEELAVLDAAIKCLAKEESDVSVMAALKDRVLARIELCSGNRDSNEPSRVVDASNRFYSEWEEWY